MVVTIKRTISITMQYNCIIADSNCSRVNEEIAYSRGRHGGGGRGHYSHGGHGGGGGRGHYSHGGHGGGGRSHYSRPYFYGGNYYPFNYSYYPYGYTNYYPIDVSLQTPYVQTELPSVTLNSQASLFGTCACDDKSKASKDYCATGYEASCQGSSCVCKSTNASNAIVDWGCGNSAQKYCP